MQEHTSKKYTTSLKQQLLHIEQNTTQYSYKEFSRLICYSYL